MVRWHFYIGSAPNCSCFVGICGVMVSVKLNLTHWGRVTHICISKLTIIGSDNGLSPGRRQAIIWTNAGILLIGPLGTNFSEILIEFHTFPFKKMHLKMSGKWRPFCLGLNVLILQVNSLAAGQSHKKMTWLWPETLVDIRETTQY